MSGIRRAESRGPSFKNPRHFSRPSDRPKGQWFCNQCMPSVDAKYYSMTRVEAAKHEGTASHLANVSLTSDWVINTDETAWGPPDLSTVQKLLLEISYPAYYNLWDLKTRVSSWRRSMEVAERGEEWKMELEFEDIPEDQRESRGWGDDAGWGSGTADDDGREAKVEIEVEGRGWGDGGGWADEGQGWGWDSPHSETSDDKNDLSESLRSFLQSCADACHMDKQRRRDMRNFLKLSTAEKVRRIEDLAWMIHGR
ncbi:hypothetical protein SISNIDRAFT_331414 [Sistotremastrum niveocremeum HHB9708]|uniref:Uncharacterized protein n=1 Tax=Sistotremastrum niveocremeum HHB9708 TaxID=1314777 RepID=A0A164XGG7_9AGAM|nr:hypothetical protein SISNIDRAFT_331414 [Sistotremastrum niveocremeum HHB9708]